MVCSGLHIMELLAQAVLVNFVCNAQPSQGLRWYFITHARGGDIKALKGIQQLVRWELSKDGFLDEVAPCAHARKAPLNHCAVRPSSRSKTERPPLCDPHPWAS